MQVLTLFGDVATEPAPKPFKNIGDYHIAEVELIYRSRNTEVEKPRITASRDAHAIFAKHWKPDTVEYYETMMLLLLNRANRVIGILEVSKGGTSGTVCDPKQVFQAAIKANAVLFWHITIPAATLRLHTLTSS